MYLFYPTLLLLLFLLLVLLLGVSELPVECWGDEDWEFWSVLV
jgi:hypothetical protein